MVYQQSTLDATFSALADPTRRAILARLAAGDRTISELASRFAMSLPAVSKHVRVLERAGLARVKQEGRVRRTTLVAAPMRQAAAWIERYRQFWEFQFDQLTAYLSAADGSPITGDQHACPPPLGKRRASTARSRSDASSPPRASASSPRGRKRKSSTGGARRAR
jgi:DNA-binding transcriptional ArsR family regulator